MVCPESNADSFWGYRHALPLFGKKATFPPLGLLTVAAMIPSRHSVTLVDMNVRRLAAADVQRADVVFVSAMTVHRESFREVVALCNDLGVPVVAGGPYPSTCYRDIEGVDHFIVNEAEETLASFLRDFEEGSAKSLYCAQDAPELSSTPAPRYDLIDVSDYLNLALQFTRGCPYDCDFCEITAMFGRRIRAKTDAQFLAELEVVYRTGYRGTIFIVDDNFIGSPGRSASVLQAIANWQQQRAYPFSFMTQVSVDLGTRDELMDLMKEANFSLVFVGLESPFDESLRLTRKHQNLRADMLCSVRLMQAKGLVVMGGFIVGFDTDPPAIFDMQIEFITSAAIPIAMAGMLVATRGTPLHSRLEQEGRLTGDFSGDPILLMEPNFVPRMPLDVLQKGYARIIDELYAPDSYYGRCLELLARLPKVPINRRDPSSLAKTRRRAFVIRAFLRLAFSAGGLQFLRYIRAAAKINPANLPVSFLFALQGRHFMRLRREFLRRHASRPR